jgi:hypothetical protein
MGVLGTSWTPTPLEKSYVEWIVANGRFDNDDHKIVSLTYSNSLIMDSPWNDLSIAFPNFQLETFSLPTETFSHLLST